MQTSWISETIHYDGTQLKPLFAYLKWGVLGDSIVAWRGSCDVSFEHMIDGEDLIAEASIAGGDMVHFIIEVFHRELATGVLIQRIFAAIVKDLLLEMSNNLDEQSLVRDGDDLYWGDRKLSISIASKSAVSTMVHFAVNVSNQGTPVRTCSLEDLGVDAREFAGAAMDAFSMEWSSVLKATCKVRPL
ncbi:MAG: hypothetical protein RJB66_1589 [Pseudomonadota bacterium]|jgi:hypothetical protein